ncbi:MAG TPA: M48 family metallopeptidase [Anaeromyxobacter sp.]|nr:M48 family metallopeptidase [Anaeromyxobacter sp.]
MTAPARATMDFFAAQAAARRRTAVLVAWFALAYAGTVAGVWAGLGVLLRIGGPAYAGVAFTPELAAGVAAAVGAVTFVGAAVHRARLAAGGAAVATMLGGVPVDRSTRDPGERRLVNVAEEMAIAAGLPVPALFVLPEQQGINAFAAGFSPDRAVVAVTRGALDRLTRDELQGVIAHELSHVLNGDARLNLQLLALVGGITALAAVGRFLARAGRRPRTRSRNDPAAAIALAGLVVWLAGSVGALCGRIIRAAVSRQREFLADAAAVQFTRNPEGLAGALARIARDGSRVESAFAPEASHLFFANGLRSDWLATHPPVEARVRRLVPQGFLRVMRRAAEEAGVAEPAAPAAVPAEAQALTPSALVASAGNAGPAHVARAARVLAALPADVVHAARDGRLAPALARALLVLPDRAARAVQLRAIEDPSLRQDVSALAEQVAPIARGDRMAVLDLALPALDGLPRDAAVALVHDLRALAAADGRTTVFEWALLRVVTRRRARATGAWRAPRIDARAAGDVQVELLELLSVLARAGAREDAGAQAALDAATAVLGLRGWRVLPAGRVGGDRLDAALERLDGASPALKSRILEACAASVLSDGIVHPQEGELVRVVAASLGVPLPPLAPAEAAVPATTSA